MDNTNDRAFSTPLILIVDDDRATRTLLKVAMEEEGYHVIEAKDGEQCLSEYHRYYPDMVLLDAIMPEMDGFTCCQKLREEDQGNHTPILMITALDDQDSIDQAFAVGAIDYITKPIHWAVLAQRVKRLLSTNKALKQLESLQHKLQRQQRWMQLFQIITHPTAPSLENILVQARQLAQVDRVILYFFDETTRLESTREDVPSTQSLSTQQIGLESSYKRQYRQGEVLAIADLRASDLDKDAIAPLVQLQTRAVLMLPLAIEQTLRGLLCIHRCQAPYLWEDWEIESFKVLGNLLVIFLQNSPLSFDSPNPISQR